MLENVSMCDTAEKIFSTMTRRWNVEFHMHHSRQKTYSFVVHSSIQSWEKLHHFCQFKIYDFEERAREKNVKCLNAAARDEKFCNMFFKFFNFFFILLMHVRTFVNSSIQMSQHKKNFISKEINVCRVCVHVHATAFFPTLNHDDRKEWIFHSENSMWIFSCIPYDELVVDSHFFRFLLSKLNVYFPSVLISYVLSTYSNDWMHLQRERETMQCCKRSTFFALDDWRWCCSNDVNDMISKWGGEARETWNLWIDNHHRHALKVLANYHTKCLCAVWRESEEVLNSDGNCLLFFHVD